jgi:hypothetical protein
VLHLTRAELDPTDAQAAVAHLQGVASGAESVVLYHLAVTESPHPAAYYPASVESLTLPGLQALWQASSPLLGREELCKTILYVADQSRGFVVNGKFDLLVEVFPASCKA